ncbi:MAG: SMC-Scp complex subunit ScpB [Bacilli bacterium]|nr:SMC-Scp complex subunit ScpB [Bacilli bacterium]MBQ6282352.1 SMC-Scp complex subunit ScpB [Bacilli bacterium]
MKAVLEGLLFVVGDDGITIDEICNVLDIDEESAKELVLSLKNDYLSEDRGLRIDYLGNSLKLTTKREHKDYYKKLIEESNHTLSQAALETLAIIVYNEPITRIKVDEIRGISSSQMIRKLVAKGFIKECGRENIPGRPILYKTTDDFLDYFGLSSKDELPKIEENETDNTETDLFLSKYKETIE